MIYLKLFYEFFKTGLFSVGGGLATLPFLDAMGGETGWFTSVELANMVAVSESTPGAIGMNMASYVGFTVAGIPGVIVASFALTAPSVIIIIIIARVLQKFRQSSLVEGVFVGIRPASTGLIASACLSIFAMCFLGGDGGLDLRMIAMFVVIWALTNPVKVTKKLHPIFFIIASAAAGILLKLE